MSRIRARLGDLEIEYDGSQEYIAKGLLAFAKEFLASFDAAPKVAARSETSIKRQTTNLSTSSIAQKLGVKTGPELAIAAAAQLILVQKKDAFSHSELLAEMRAAKMFYKKSFHSNLGQTLKTLVSAGRLNHIGGDDYSLSAKETSDLGAKLA